MAPGERDMGGKGGLSGQPTKLLERHGPFGHAEKLSLVQRNANDHRYS